MMRGVWRYVQSHKVVLSKEREQWWADRDCRLGTKSIGKSVLTGNSGFRAMTRLDRYEAEMYGQLFSQWRLADTHVLVVLSWLNELVLVCSE